MLTKEVSLEKVLSLRKKTPSLQKDKGTQVKHADIQKQNASCRLKARCLEIWKLFPFWIVLRKSLFCLVFPICKMVAVPVSSSTYNNLWYMVGAQWTHSISFVEYLMYARHISYDYGFSNEQNNQSLCSQIRKHRGKNIKYMYFFIPNK